MDDIVPGLLEKIQEEFEELYQNNEEIQRVLKIIQNNKGTYEEADYYAYELGDILTKCLDSNFSSNLPDDTLYYNIATRILEPTYANNFSLISDASIKVQQSLNENAGIGLKVVEPEFNKPKFESIINSVSNKQYSEVSSLLKKMTLTFSQEIVEETLQKNVDSHYQAGLSPKVIRKVSPGCTCERCLARQGTFEYPNVPDYVWKRHDNCRCLVLYYPGEGRKFQNVHSKEWVDKEEIDKRISFSNGIQLSYCKSIKTEWLKRFDKDKAKVEYRDYWEYKGEKLVVDGHKVKQDHEPEEKAVAELLSNKLGTKVELVPRVNFPQNVQTPDYLIDDKGFDLKRITGVGKNVIDGAVQDHKQQATNFVLDITKTPLSLSEVFERIDKVYWSKNRSWVNIMIVIKGNDLIDILDRK